MADAVTETDERTVRLQVAAARQEESGHGIARLPKSALSQIGAMEGDTLEIVGKDTTVARAMLAYPEDEELQVIRLDGLQRGNAETGSGEYVKVRKAESRPAQRVVFAPAQQKMRLQGPTMALKRNFLGRPMMAGDLVATTGHQQVQDIPPQLARMFNTPAYALTQIRLNVVATTPKGIVHIDENTEVELREVYEEAQASRGDINYDDVGGMSDTIRQLREMVELPLRYPELFTRLGVDPPRGMARRGPARRGWRRPWPLRATPTSCSSTGQRSWVRATARARRRCAACSRKRRRPRPPSSSSTRSIRSRPSVRTSTARRRSALSRSC
jgi:transitional endoplasmic reticulum ATPase